MATKKKQDARSVATHVLTRVIGQGRSLADCLENELTYLDEPRERALAQALCYGVMRWYTQLNSLLNKLLSKPIRKKDTDVRVVLLLGLYQHLYSRIPDHAATAETVNLIRSLKKPWAKGLVNAVLRNFTRQREQLLAQINQQPHSALSHPKWILQRLEADWDTNIAHAIAQANNIHPPMTLRVNQRLINRDAYLSLLAEANIDAFATEYSPVGVQLVQATDVQNLPYFAEGYVSVQDEAAQLAAPLLDVPEGGRVLDACAAPGGKTAHILELYNAAEVVAIDNQADRVEKIHDTLQRLALQATVVCADAGQPDTWWDNQQFDAILLDVPCSASGVIRRHPDIKYLRQADDIAALAQQQAAILTAAWALLKPQGKLVYTTCSVFAEENHVQIEKFLKNHANAKHLPLHVTWGHSTPVGRQLLPRDATAETTQSSTPDGFYYACLLKTS